MENEPERQPSVNRAFGILATTAGLGMAVISARFGIESYLKQPVMAISSNINQAEKAVAILGFLAGSSIASTGIALSVITKD